MYGTRTLLRKRRRVELRGRVVVVTGASSGLGLLIARHAAGQGAMLALAARDAGELTEVAAELRAAGAEEVFVVPTDVTKPEEIERLINQTIAKYGRIDVLINNAGTMLVGPLEAMTAEDFERVLAVNFWGGVRATLAALPHMRAAGFGRIANVVSVGGRAVVPHMAPYTASKYAFTGFTKAIRAELARDNILVTGVYPGPIRTGGHRHAWFKGDTAAEYAWFAAADTVPGISTSADACARALLEGVCNGDPEVNVGPSTHLSIVLEGLFPDWAAELNALVDRAMPAPENLSAPAVQGHSLAGKVPSVLGKLISGATPS